MKARTINTGSDEFRMFAIGPVGKLQEKAIQIIRAGKELLLAYKSEADIEGIAIYTYGYYTPKQYGNCGLQVYNGDGDLVFDSNQAPLLLHASTIEDSGYYDNGTDLAGISSFDAEMAAIMISPDIEVLGATGEPFADFIQFYVRIVSPPCTFIFRRRVARRSDCQCGQRGKYYPHASRYKPLHETKQCR